MTLGYCLGTFWIPLFLKNITNNSCLDLRFHYYIPNVSHDIQILYTKKHGKLTWGIYHQHFGKASKYGNFTKKHGHLSPIRIEGCLGNLHAINNHKETWKFRTNQNRDILGYMTKHILWRSNLVISMNNGGWGRFPTWTSSRTLDILETVWEKPECQWWT